MTNNEIGIIIDAINKQVNDLLEIGEKEKAESLIDARESLKCLSTWT